jgi:hypothetical protein
VTESWSRFLRRGDDGSDGMIAERALWWPPAKIAGRQLAATWSCWMRRPDVQRSPIEEVAAAELL